MSPSNLLRQVTLVPRLNVAVTTRGAASQLYKLFQLFMKYDASWKSSVHDACKITCAQL